MASSSRSAGLVALVLGGAFVMAIGCSSGSGKKPVLPGDDAGAGGTADEAGGAAGASEPGTAGEGGEAPTASAGAAGAAGSEAEGGAAGATSAACTPTGDPIGTSFPVEVIYKVCRGAGQLVSYDVMSSPQQFTCCGVSDTTPAPYSVLLSAVSNNDGGGQFSFIVPEDAPLGAQTISAACGGGNVANNLALEVSDAAVPQVTGVTDSVQTGGTLVVTGSDLSGVTDIIALADDGTNYPCTFGPTSAQDDAIQCDLGLNVPVGDYLLVAYQADCGYAVNTPAFTVVATTL